MTKELHIKEFKDARGKWRYHIKLGGRIVLDSAQGYTRVSTMRRVRGNIITKISLGLITLK